MNWIWCYIRDVGKSIARNFLKYKLGLFVGDGRENWIYGYCCNNEKHLRDLVENFQLLRKLSNTIFLPRLFSCSSQNSILLFTDYAIFFCISFNKNFMGIYNKIFFILFLKSVDEIIRMIIENNIFVLMVLLFHRTICRSMGKLALCLSKFLSKILLFKKSYINNKIFPNTPDN